LPTDICGDALPRGAIARLGTTRFNHLGSISSIAFAPDGRTLASAGKADERGHWDSARGSVTRRWRSETDKVVRVWDRATGTAIRELRGHQEAVLHITFAPNARTLVSAGEDKTIRIWDVDSGGQVWVLEGYERPVVFVIFSPDGKTLATSSDVGEVRLWSVATGKELLRLDQPKLEDPYLLVFSPDSTMLFAAQSKGGQTLEQWDVATGKRLRSIKAHENGISCISLSPDGRLLASADCAEIALWDVVRWKRLRQVGEGGASVIVFSPDGTTIAGDNGRKVSLWRADTGERIRDMNGPGSKGANCLAFSLDGKTLASDFGGNFIRLWETDTGKEILPHVGHESTVRCAAFSPDGRVIITSSDDQTLRLWDTFTDRQLHCLTEDPSDYSGRGTILELFCLACSPSQEILAGGSWNRVYLLDGRSGKPVQVWHGQDDDAIAHLAFSADGTRLAWGINTQSVYVVDVRPGAKPRNLLGTEPKTPGREAVGFVLALAPDGRTLLCGQKAEPYVCRDVATGRERYRLAVPGLRTASFLPDGRTLLSVNIDDTISLWDASTGNQVRSCKYARKARVGSLAPDGKTLAVGNADGTVSLWDVRAGRERHQFDGHHTAVSCLAFSRDGKLLVSGSEDGTVLVWDVEGRLAGKTPQVFPVSTRQADTLWDILGSDDVVEVHWAMAGLSEAARGEPSLLLERLRPLLQADGNRIGPLIADLDDQRFEARQRASRELRKLDDLAEPALRQALAGRPSPELRRRLEALLAELGSAPFSPRRARLQRAVEVLERAGSEEARAALQQIIREAPGSWLREQAKNSLERLERTRSWRSKEVKTR
jgi:WD40 repeat protein